MIRKALLAAAVVFTGAALAGTLLARPSGAAKRQYTVGYLTYVNYWTGGREPARRLDVRIVTPACNLRAPRCSPREWLRAFKSMIARRVDAIVNDGYSPTLIPILRKVRRAGILLIAAGDDIAGKRDLWVSPADPVAYGEALADALASQVGNKGEFAILDEEGEYPVVHSWEHVIEHYVARAYPEMTSDGVVTESGAGDPTEVDAVKAFMSAHPHLKGLIAVTPTETYMAGEAITEAGRIGQVFSSGNGGSSLADPQERGYVQSGATRLVFAQNPLKLGYLTTWAAHYLLTGHHFTHQAYQVGGPIGLVWYYPSHRELRLSQPLTVTKQNLAFWAKKF